MHCARNLKMIEMIDKINGKNIKRWFAVLLFMVAGISSGQNQLIPRPQFIAVEKDFYALEKEIKIRLNQKIPELEFLKNQIEEQTNYRVAWTSDEGDVTAVIGNAVVEGFPESYELKIDGDGIMIASATNQGIFYGVQTLSQLIREYRDRSKLPYLEIKDFPKFTYRGMMLDVGRHFFTVEEVKKFIDYLSWYKYNKFHWHLTEDQGWRIEIKKYPKLTEVGAWRKETQIGRYFDYNRYDGKKHGGFYTQDEIREVVDYARQRHIDVIPEIEMPGHAQAAIASYPELGCTGKPIEVWTRWGVSLDVFCPNEVTFKFLEEVIDEVVELFPYEYIHIGGDEAAKEQWRESALVQQLIDSLDLKDEEGMQSYFIERMEKYINSKGRKIIGFDEILQGGIAPNATVMSWRGEEGGIEAVKLGHQAIMTPASTNYFDYYQGDPASEPLAWGGDLRLKKVYAYHPIPRGLSYGQSKFIIGPQANVWTEYISDFDHVEYMIFPRLFALSEVAWGTADPENYRGFENRVIDEFDLLDQKKISYSRAIFEVHGETLMDNNQLYCKLEAADHSQDIRYTTDGTEPDANSARYTQPIPITQSRTVKAANFRKDKKVSEDWVQHFKWSKSTGKKITLTYFTESPYTEKGPETLIDGIYGEEENHRVKWLGIREKDLIATIDLLEETEFKHVRLNSLQLPDWEIYYPTEIKIEVSNDGQNFEAVTSLNAATIKKSEGKINLSFPTQNARYVRVTAENIGIIPKDKSGAGKKAFVLVDEIAID